jgi:3-phytase
MHRLARAVLTAAILFLALFPGGCRLFGRETEPVYVPRDVPVVAPHLVLADDAVRDQDDMCIWVHPQRPADSLLVTSDKDANRLFVYDLAGKRLQTLDVPQPGNIDVRPGFPLGEGKVDIVAVNQRKQGFRIRVYAVDPQARRLARVDNDAILTGPNYGGTLYRSAKTGRFYFITTSMEGVCEQVELTDDGSGRVAGRKVRTWRAGYAEGAVADDARGRLYVAAEDDGVWELGAEPDDPAPGRLVLRVGQHGLVDDLEGVAIHPDLAGGPALLVSNQGASNFKVFRLPDLAPLGTFGVAGARATDGIAVEPRDLGGPWSGGLFACHTATEPRCPVLVVPWPRIAEVLERKP